MWRALLQNISSFLCLSSRDGFDSEPVRKSYLKIEEILKLLKPILDAIMDTEVASDDLFNKVLEELGLFIDESQDLLESWHPLSSRVDLVRFFIFGFPVTILSLAYNLLQSTCSAP